MLLRGDNELCSGQALAQDKMEEAADYALNKKQKGQEHMFLPLAEFRS